MNTFYFWRVNQKLKIFTLAVTFFYCFAIGVVSGSSVQGNLLSKAKSDDSAFISTAAITLFNYQNQKENRVNVQFNFLAKDFKDAFNLLKPFSQILSQLFKTEIGQYSRFTRQLLIQKKISYLIFPFNYFW